MHLEHRIPIRVERHALGPRVYVLGHRAHEWHLGASLLALLALGVAVGVVREALPITLAAGAAVWLVAKDWPDLVGASRDSAEWRLGFHRRPLPLRRVSRAEPLPALTGVVVAVFAVVNLLSALTPNVTWRGLALLQVETSSGLHVFHALAIPSSVALLVTSYYLYRRRRRALQLAVGLLIALAVFNLLKGLDFEEAAGDVVAACLLFAGRGAFYVRHEPISRSAAVLRVPIVLAGGFVTSLLLVAIAAQPPPGTAVRETADLLLWRTGPIVFHDELGRMGLAVGLVGMATLLVAAYLLFRPLAAPRDLPDPKLRRAATDLVRRHGTDTLAYFKLRRDQHYLFGRDRRAFLGYRIQSGVLTVSGDPVGAVDAVPPLLTQLATFAEQRGLRVAVLGASEQLRPLWEQLGLRPFYMGDEAIVDTATFSLEGRAIRKVRQSVSRLEKAGYRAELVPLAELDAASYASLEDISSLWRAGTVERGFSMSLDALRRDDQGDTLLLVARDSAREIRGFLHFVPTYGRPAASLSMMRRDPRTPNGLTEFMVAQAIEQLRRRGVEELSLNFAVFARFLHNPAGQFERFLGRLARRADAAFQIERIYRFNAKFFPRWESRYLMYEGILVLPRTALASLWLEGQVPRPKRHGRGLPLSSTSERDRAT
jgi:lysyl-tRNA synthetase class 2